MASVKVLVEKLHPTIPSRTEFPIIADVMKGCFQYDCNDRPSFVEVCYQLQVGDGTTRPSMSQNQGSDDYGKFKNVKKVDDGYGRFNSTTLKPPPLPLFTPDKVNPSEDYGSAMRPPIRPPRQEEMKSGAEYSSFVFQKRS